MPAARHISRSPCMALAVIATIRGRSPTRQRLQMALLASSPVFVSLNEVDRVEFADHARTRNYHKGEFLCMHGDSWPYLFMIARGLIDAQKASTEGRSLLIATFGEGEIFWGLSLFDDQVVMPVTLEARQPSRVYLWERSYCQSCHFCFYRFVDWFVSVRSHIVV